MTSDDVPITYKIVYRLDRAGGAYVAGDQEYPNREEAEKAIRKEMDPRLAELFQPRHIDIFPTWRIARVIEDLNRYVSPSNALAAFDKIIEANAVATDSDSLASDVALILQQVGKGCER